MISRSFSGSWSLKNSIRERLVDDHDRRRHAVVAIGEFAAVLDRES